MASARVIKYLLVVLLSSALGNVWGKAGPYIELENAKANPEEVKYLQVNCDSTGIDTLQFYIKDFAHIAGISFHGKPRSEEQLWKILSHLRMIEQIIFIDNDLHTIQSGGSSSTIKDLWVKGSPNLDVNSINSLLRKASYIQTLRIDSVQSEVVPFEISNLKLLKHLQISKCGWSFEEIAGLVKGLERLNKLILSDNDFQIVGSEIKKLKTISYVDLSGNQLVELPKKFRKLEDLDTLILNRNIISDKEELAEMFKSLRFKYLVFDGDSSDVEKNVEYRLPGKKIEWSNRRMSDYYFTLPNHVVEAENISEKIDSIQLATRMLKDLGSNKTRLFSPAYIVYDKLTFPDPLRNFDTVSFKGRYLSRDYEFSRKIVYQNHTENGYYYPLKYDKSHHKYYKKKGLKKLKHRKHSPLQFVIEKTPKEQEGLLLISIHIDKDRKDLDAYRGVVWEVVDYNSASEGSFKSRYMNMKTWGDLRLTLEDEEDGTHKVVLKGRFVDDSLYVIPRKASDLMNEKFIKKSVPKMHKKYLKNMKKMEKKFDKKLMRDIKKLQRKDINRINALWQIVEEKMSEDEKKLSRPLWTLYYLDVMKNQWPLLASAKLDLMYLSRFMESQGFKESAGEDFFVGQKWKRIIVFDKDSVTYEFSDYCLIDLDRKLVKYYEADSLNEILVEPFHQYLFVGKLKNSNRMVILSQDETQQLFSNSAYITTSENLVNAGGTNAFFYRRYILSAMNKVVY